MNYSSEETLRIKLSEYIDDRTGQEFSVIEKCDASHIKSLIIEQYNYDRYENSPDLRLVIIPGTVSRLVAVETIKITAYITELPVCLSELNNLRLLDLTGCYNHLSIPEEILKMKDLRIKIGGIISKASEVVFITVPLNGITQEVFSEISSAQEKEIEQLIIRQMPTNSLFDYQESFAVPDEIKDFHELQLLCITGNISSVPSWVGNMSRLGTLTVSYSSIFQSLPESIWNLSNLTSLNLSGCSKLVSLPSCIGNLSNLLSLNLSECYSLEMLPENIGNLSNLTSLNLNGYKNLRSLPESIENLSNLTSLDLSGCSNLVSLPSSIGNLSKLTTLTISFGNSEFLMALRELPDIKPHFTGFEWMLLS